MRKREIESWVRKYRESPVNKPRMIYPRPAGADRRRKAARNQTPARPPGGGYSGHGEAMERRFAFWLAWPLIVWAAWTVLCHLRLWR